MGVLVISFMMFSNRQADPAPLPSPARGEGRTPGSSPCRSRGRKRDRERIATEDHQRNQPPDGLLGVCVDPEQFGRVPDRCRLGLDLPPHRPQGSPLGLEIGKGGTLTLPLTSELGTGFPLPFDRRERRGGLAASGCFLDRHVHLVEPAVQVGNGVGRNLDAGGERCVLRHDGGRGHAVFPDMGRYQLSVHARRIDDSEPGDQDDEDPTPDPGCRTPPPGEPAVMSLAPSMATAIAITEFGELGKRTNIPRIENQAAAPARATAAP
jgi:hypothetical protein